MHTLWYPLLILSILFVAVAFLGSETPSARGFYYAVWLGIMAMFWRRRESFARIFQSSPWGSGVTFIVLGWFMIGLEETLAGVAVNILQVTDVFSLLAILPQYYANNFFLLSGFLVAWYILLRCYSYSQKEVFILVGLFGLFSEKIYVHVLSIPLLGIPLILPTMFTYMGIIAPSILSLKETGNRTLPPLVRYTVGMLFPLVVSMPFFLMHQWLTSLGFIDPTILTR